MSHYRRLNWTILILLLYSHSCCSHAPQEIPTPRVYPGQTTDPIFWPYIHDFPGSTDVYIVFDDNLAGKHEEPEKKTKVVGTCFHRWGAPSEIGINVKYWKKASNAERKLLLWHELGHCSLRLPHNDSTSDVIINEETGFHAVLWNSIMSSFIWGATMIVYNCEFNYNLDDFSDQYCISIANDGSIYELIED